MVDIMTIPNRFINKEKFEEKSEKVVIMILNNLYYLLLYLMPIYSKYFNFVLSSGVLFIPQRSSYISSSRFTAFEHPIIFNIFLLN